ncbi:hypothetical protein [Geomonas ferrireducens]|uniref:hypothetical protein n=1 Tax=Geomonas ferrireducens TaxID=2570227 RepID=UPI0010A81F4F|nr:hypothetical protein [Geomonas ferrireducens]
MGIKSSWPGAENSTPINSRAISEFNTHNPVPRSTPFIYEDDFRVRIKHIDETFAEVKSHLHRENSAALKICIKQLKEYFHTCKRLEKNVFTKIVNAVVGNLNVLPKSQCFDQIDALRNYFLKEISAYDDDYVKGKARKIKT